MKLSDAIAAGAAVLKTTGPSRDISPVFIEAPTKPTPAKGRSFRKYHRAVVAGLNRCDAVGFCLIAPSSSATAVMAVNDVLTAAQLGLLGRAPTHEEYLAFYWANPWGATHNTLLLNWMRAVEAHRYRWADVISKLRAFGA